MNPRSVRTRTFWASGQLTRALHNSFTNFKFLDFHSKHFFFTTMTGYVPINIPSVCQSNFFFSEKIFFPFCRVIIKLHRRASVGRGCALTYNSMNPRSRLKIFVGILLIFLSSWFSFAQSYLLEILWIEFMKRVFIKDPSHL